MFPPHHFLTFWVATRFHLEAWISQGPGGSTCCSSPDAGAWAQYQQWDGSTVAGGLVGNMDLLSVHAFLSILLRELLGRTNHLLSSGKFIGWQSNLGSNLANALKYSVLTEKLGSSKTKVSGNYCHWKDSLLLIVPKRRGQAMPRQGWCEET